MVHAIVEQMEPSDEQRPAITWRGGDLLVTAGAGSGKTRTLVARYLALLAEGLPLRSLVAVTFTRKAAREMRNRVRLQVQRYLERGDLEAAEQQRWLEVYGALDAARIGTIHALCSELLRAHPAEAGVDPRFEVLDEAQTGLLRKQAVDEALAWAANTAEASGLYELLGEGGLRSVAERMLERRLEAAPVLAKCAAPWCAWQAILIQPLQAFVDGQRVREAFEGLCALRGSGILARAEAAGDELAPCVQGLCGKWEALCAARRAGDWEAVSAGVSALDGLLKQKGRKGNWAPEDPKATIKDLRALYDEVPSWLCKGDLALDRQVAEAMPALSKLYASMAGAYDRLRGERNALDFDDLEDKAVELLDRRPEVVARWHEDVQAILVDEFQDTNRRQLKLVHQLNGGRGVAFYVGDDKQSIYRFRGAEVSLFRDLKRRAAEYAEEEKRRSAALRLGISYRAHRELLAGLNTLLRPVLGAQAEEDLQEHRKEPDPGWAPPYIELHLTVGTRGEDKALERAACALAERLRELAESGRKVKEGDLLRPLGYGDMAILCRATRSFAAYEDALDGAGVPFTTVAGRGFYQRPEIRDLLNALRALSEPTDDLAVAGLLRSPALGLSDVALYQLCRQREESHAGLWQVLHGSLADLEPAERERARRAAKLMDDLRVRVGRDAVADLLKAFVDDTCYKAALRQAGQGRAARNVDKLLADANDSGIVSVGEFLEYVALLRDAGTREGEARATSEGAVQIMSVHAAKGLEFPIVVLGDISAQKRSGNGMLLDSELGVLLPLRGQDEAAEIGYGQARGRLPAMYLRAREQEDKQEQDESARLLYVAATRARDMLLISGCMRLDKNSRPAGLGEWLGWLAEPLGLGEQNIAYQETGQSVVRVALPAGGASVACAVYEPGCSWERAGSAEPEPDELPAATDLPMLGPCGRLPRKGQEAEEESEPGQRAWQVMPRRGRGRAPQRIVGELVHEALSAWRFPDAGFQAWAEARARTLGLIDAHALRDAAERSAALLWRFKRHELYREMVGADQRLAEVPYSLRGEDGRTDNGVIDVLYRRAGQWTIVEFKTDHVKDAADAKQVLGDKNYSQQAKRYVRAVQELLGEEPRHLFCWLDHGGKVVCEPALE